MAEVRARGCSGKADRLDLPRLDAGFALRAGVLLPGAMGGHGDRTTFNRLALGSGGLAAIDGLPPAARPGTGSPATPTHSSSATPSASRSAQHDDIPFSQPYHAEGPATRGVSQGLSRGVGRGVAGLSPSPGMMASTGVLASSEGVSQCSPDYSSVGGEKEVGKAGGPTHTAPLRTESGADSPATPPEAIAPGDAVEVFNSVLRCWQNGWRLVAGPDMEGLYRIQKTQGCRSQHVRRGAIRGCAERPDSAPFSAPECPARAPEDVDTG